MAIPWRGWGATSSEPSWRASPPSPAREVAQRVIDALVAPFVVGERDVFARASIGIALSRPETAGPDDLLRDADVALYRAKESGRHTAVVFEVDMAEAVAAWVALEADLRQALERDELMLHYQPIVELASGRIVAAEALLRWDHPQRGMISPDEFIPLAEETHLIEAIDSWVLEQACRQASAWQPAEPGEAPFGISVNLSARQFRNERLIDEVRAVLARTGLPAAALKLEITEHVLIDETAATARTLSDLQKLGVKLAIDDFGTGYSSLGYLRHLPVDGLKMDSVFVRGLGREAGGAAIVEAIVALAYALGMRVTAEGIETAEQLVYLRSIGCDRGQGFLFAHGLPADELSSRLKLTWPVLGAAVSRLSAASTD